ncbi:phosphate signaling complex protein PhoU [Hathewaya limosa]|uniref:Phosphate-specific transport system accessory protein PhoU n=1 Tax=Hathewaya limosa TaxID=1536 RepID=A0ABU0JSS0_HATLI|nr:phosphate signaling complex protein PhoU [Hathewaya limosa]AWZ49829.1 phosphate transport system regulatory protein PhoU [Clostridiaceae bacterium 14S0207]MDQ0478977.1 phosphate transport system protein [Hathewaya limosa]
MVRVSFESSMEELHNDIIRMGSMVEKQLYNAVKSVLNKDSIMAEEIIKKDDEIDDFEKDIEDKAIKLIATQQPLAGDLRNIFTSTKIVTDLERIADHAVNISKMTIKIKNSNMEQELVLINDIVEIILNMFRESLDSYVEGNVKKAYEVCAMDDEVDRLYGLAFTKIIDSINEKSKDIDTIYRILLAYKYLERIGDHITNICEWTIYLVTGEKVDLNE